MPQSCSTKNTIYDLAARKRRREKRRLRKRVISSGWKTNVLNSFCLIAASLLCFAHFEHLQADADYKLFEIGSVFDNNLKHNLHGIVCNGHWISALMLFFHILAIKFAKTRFTFLCLLAFLAWIVNAFLHMEQNHHQDYLISRLAFSAFTVLITTAIVFLPKKIKHMKRQNTLYSGFSVASTSTSQQTSQFNNSQLSFGNRSIDFDDTATMLSGRTYLSTNSTNGLMRDKMMRNNAWLLDNRNRFPYNSSTIKGNSETATDTMSLRSGKTLSSNTTQSTFSRWREKNRESTPMREVCQLVDNLWLNNSTEEDSSSDEMIGTLTGRKNQNIQFVSHNC